MKTKKLNQILTRYNLLLLVITLSTLGIYHLLMTLLIENTFNFNANEVKEVKFILIRFYHISTLLLIGLGTYFTWSKKVNWIWLYVGFRIIYTALRIFPEIDKTLSKTLIDGFSSGILIIVILLILIKND